MRIFQTILSQAAAHARRASTPLCANRRFINTIEPLSAAVAARSATPNVATSGLTFGNNASLEEALCDVERIVADKNGRRPNLQRVISDEVDIVTEILQKLVGTNSSLSQVEKIYAGQNQETIHGLSVLLFTKMNPGGEKKLDAKVFQSQLIVAKVVEMINMAMRVHDMVRNIDADEINNTEAGQAIHLNNKCSVLYGDFMWAKGWKDLADLHQMSVIDQMVSVLVNTTQGQFLLEQEAHNLEDKLNPEYWLEKNLLVSGCLPAFGCRSVLELAEAPKELHSAANEFGQNFGLYMKGLREVNWFQSPVRKAEPIDFISLPLITHANQTGEDVSKMIVAGTKLSEPATVNFDLLYHTVRSSSAVMNSKAKIEEFRALSFSALNRFPESDAQRCLKRILDTLQ